MQNNSLRSSEQSLFLDFTYSSGNEGDLSFERQPQSSKSSRKKEKIASKTKTNLTPQTSKSELLSRSNSRLSGGESKQKSRTLVTSNGETLCSQKAPGVKYHRQTDVAQVHLQLYARPKTFNEDYFLCNQPPKPKPKTTRGTQSLYRESSAQTLPYLPEVKNDPKALEFIEVFKLPEILPGVGPPGLYEVEVLERARKRWAFAEALKENFKNSIDKARGQMNKKQHKKILESFAFEQWIEREEYIMECQMMRLDIVIRMFNQREQKMHENSRSAIEVAYEQILAKRDAALKKNDIAYKRAMRRLESVKLKRPRDWRGYNKESLAQQLCDPQSLYYAPQTRFGVSPNQRHFQGDVRKVFDIKTENIEKMQFERKDIECPFAKLKEWSKPKDIIREIETNFLSDENLQKLYETLKSLRLQFVKHKTQPKCLIRKHLSQIVEEKPTEKDEGSEDEHKIIQHKPEIRFLNPSTINDEMNRIRPHRKPLRKFVSFIHHSKEEKRFRRILFHDRRRAEIEAMVSSYEGKTIGWILRFLGEEMLRLEELRKLHFITILAQRERWRREAAEAGLRQKESDMRAFFEEMFETVDNLNSTACEDFFGEIMPPDTQAYADDLATTSVTKLAKTIDDDLNRWLKSFEAIQNPNNYDQLRILLRDMVFPNIEQIMYKKEESQVVHYIINDVLFPKVYKELETFDISFAISNDLVDRLIDNDLYFFSSECDMDCDCKTVCTCPVEDRETKAILRKLVRYAVPGRRWKTSTERIAYENFMDVIDDAFDQMDIQEDDDSIDEIGCLQILHKNRSFYDIINPQNPQFSDSISMYDKQRPSESFTNLNNFQDAISLNTLRRINSEIDIHYPRSKLLTTQNISCPSLNEVELETIIQSDKPSQSSLFVKPKSTLKESIVEILHDIIKSIDVIEDTESSIKDWVEGENEQWAEYESIEEENDGQPSTEDVAIEESSRSDNKSEDTKSYESSSYEEINESELERMAEDKCKCRDEILREMFLAQQIASGKVRIKRKEVDIPMPEQISFEYQSDDKEKEQEEDEGQESEVIDEDVSSDQDYISGITEYESDKEDKLENEKTQLELDSKTTDEQPKMEVVEEPATVVAQPEVEEEDDEYGEVIIEEIENNNLAEESPAAAENEQQTNIEDGPVPEEQPVTEEAPPVQDETA